MPRHEDLNAASPHKTRSLMRSSCGRRLRGRGSPRAGRSVSCVGEPVEGRRAFASITAPGKLDWDRHCGPTVLVTAGPFLGIADYAPQDSERSRVWNGKPADAFRTLHLSSSARPLSELLSWVRLPHVSPPTISRLAGRSDSRLSGIAISPG